MLKMKQKLIINSDDTINIHNRIANLLFHWLFSVSFNRRSQVVEAAIDSFTQPKSKGRVVKVTAPPEFDPEKLRTGGRVVKRMPRQLKQMKEAQETPRE